MSDIVKPGEQTTEFKETKANNLWSTIAIVVGLLVTIAGHFVDQGGTIGQIAGMVISVGGLITRTLATLGYSNGRAVVKAAASKNGSG